MVSGAATCASDHAYVPPAQSKASSMSVALVMKRTDPIGSKLQKVALKDIFPYSLFGGQ